jgi:Tachylectin
MRGCIAILKWVCSTCWLFFALHANAVELPLSKSTARESAEAFQARADVIVRGNACDSELHYYKIRAELADGEYENQGEALTGILIAKAYWVARRGSESCASQMDRATYDSLQAIWHDHPSFDDELPPFAVVNSKCTQFASDSPTSPTVRVTITPECLKKQINGSVRKMKKVSRLGTNTKFSCTLWFPRPGTSGEWDVNVRDLVRLLYTGKDAGIFEQSTIDYMYEELLSARGEVGSSEFSALNACIDHDLGGEQLGKPEDWADQEGFGEEILSFLGDAGTWLGNFLAKAALFSGFAGFAVGVMTVEGVAMIGPLTHQAITAGLFATVALADPGSILDPFDVRIPETENHRLMIESSRYLTNADILRIIKDRKPADVDQDDIAKLEEQQRSVVNWLLMRLQSIAMDDFAEYNSRAYTRYSLLAIMNLFDFADPNDPGGWQIKNAARIALDLSAAKFAAGSNRGRRIVPYRRKAENDGWGWDGADPITAPKNLYNNVQGADFEVVRFMILAGQLQPAELPRSACAWYGTPAFHLCFDSQGYTFDLQGYILDNDYINTLVGVATSSYRLPRAILEVAVERKAPFMQDVRHAGVELYYSQAGFTASAGGVRTDPPLTKILFGVIPWSYSADAGIAMPTSIIPTKSGVAVDDLFQFRGVGTGDERTENLCVWKGFICGIAPHLPVRDDCVLKESPAPDVTVRYIDMGVCTKQFGFYVVAAEAPCKANSFCDAGQKYGFMEAVEAAGEDFNVFLNGRRAAVAEAFTASGDAWRTYRSWSGDLIEFHLAQAQPQILYVNRMPRPAPETKGAVIKSDRKGRATIRSPWSDEQIDVDISNNLSPHITFRTANIEEAKAVAHPRSSSSPGMTFESANQGSSVQIYRVKGSGELDWRTHLDPVAAETGLLGLVGPNRLGFGWDNKIIPVLGSPIFYTMTANGDLYWNRHDGFRSGEDTWTRNSARVGNGWHTATSIVAAEDGVVYARQADGRLDWFKHTGQRSGTYNWDGPKTVAPASAGWGEYTTIFAGSDGVLYGVKPNGDLEWRKHLGYLNGDDRWSEAKKVGDRWDAPKAIISAGRGVFYLVTPEDNGLKWYHHKGAADGTYSWDNPVTIDTGWNDVKAAFALRGAR